MHRAGKRFLRAALGLCAALALFLPRAALAFHSGSVFDKPPGAGGGGGIFYTGAPLERGWTCSLCHTGAPGKVKLKLRVEPKELFDSFTYVPGQTYTFTAKLEGESVGMGSPLSNYNAIAVAITDEKGFSVGSIGGFKPEDFYAGNPTEIASAGQKPGETSWTFAYTAPDPPAGTLTIYLAAVDGNGADSPPTKTLTDPFGDDVFTGTVTLKQGGTASLPGGSPPSEAPAVTMAAALAAGAFRRRRRRGTN